MRPPWVRAPGSSWRVGPPSAPPLRRSRHPVERGEVGRRRSEEHTSELQSHVNLVCRLLLEKKTVAPSSTHRGTATVVRPTAAVVPRPVGPRQRDLQSARGGAAGGSARPGGAGAELEHSHTAARDIADYVCTHGRPTGAGDRAYEPGRAGASRPSSFFFRDTAATDSYTLSLHDALPI